MEEETKTQQNEQIEQTEQTEQTEQSEFYKETEDALKQMYFDILDQDDDLREKFYQMTKEENRNKETETQMAKQIITHERYYDIVADFAKTWGQVKGDTTECPQEIIAGAQIVGEFTKQQIHGNLQKEVDNSIKEAILAKYKINEELTEEVVEKFMTSFSQKERMSDIDKEENWENLSQMGDDDVVYLNEDQANAFEIEDEDEGEEYQMPEMDEEKKSDYEFDMQQDKDKQDESEFQLKGHIDFVTRVHLSPNGKYLLSGSGDDTAIVWDLEKKTVLEQLPKMKETVDCAKFNHDGSMFAIGALDGELLVFNFKDGKVTDKKQLEGIEEEITFIDWHQKGNAVIAGGNANVAHMWNANKGDLVHSFYGHEDIINFGCFNPEGTQIMTVSADKSLRTWSPKTGQELKKITGYGFHEDSINVLAFHKDKQIIVTGSEDNTACISNYATGKPMGRTEAHGGIVDSVVITSQLDLFITGSSDGFCRIFNLSNMKNIREKIMLSGSITKLVEIPQKQQIIASSSNGRLYMFDYRKPKEVFVQKGYGETIHDFTLDKEMKGCYTACEDGVIRYFNFANFKLQE